MFIRRVWSLAALPLVLILTGCPPAPEGPGEEQRNPFYLSGMERRKAMDYKGAIESFERALQENPRSALAHFELGVIYDQYQPDYAAALYHYNKALQLRPSGYPADNIRQRIPACRQELVKADSLAVVNPSALRDLERLREENQQLRQQMVALQSDLAAARSASSLTGAGGPGTSPVSANSGGNWRTSAPTGSGRSTTAPTGTGGRSPTDSGRVRFHTVRSGETLAAISRKYNVRLEAITALNPGLDPRRMKIGQTVKVPSP